jgi:Calcineurin-like phosphoesterase
MARDFHIAILSDVHYACAEEQARGDDYEYRDLPNPLRFLNWAYRHFLWLRHPLRHNAQLDKFLRRAGTPDWVIANGDYNCDTQFVGVSDDAALQSARECLGKLRTKFAPNFRATFGDHELGKMSMLGGRGGIRLASWRRAREELGLEPLWRVDLGNRVLLGVTSTLIALPLFEADALPEERAEWRQLSEEHLARIRENFQGLKPNQRVLLFCHDPSALPFLWREEIVRGKISQVEQTIIGHLHSNLVYRNSRLLAGMPRIGFLGHTTKRLSTALSKARDWRPFKVRLCPSLAGIELLKDGGYYTVDLDEEAVQAPRFQFHRIKWHED